MRVLQVRCNQRIILKHSLYFWNRDPMLLAFRPVAAVPIEAVGLKVNHSKGLCKCIYKCKLALEAEIRSYFPASSFFSVSLTSLPSTRAPPNLAMTFFITVPI